MGTQTQPHNTTHTHTWCTHSTHLYLECGHRTCLHVRRCSASSFFSIMGQSELLGQGEGANSHSTSCSLGGGGGGQVSPYRVTGNTAYRHLSACHSTTAPGTARSSTAPGTAQLQESTHWRGATTVDSNVLGLITHMYIHMHTLAVTHCLWCILTTTGQPLEATSYSSGMSGLGWQP